MMMIDEERDQPGQKSGRTIHAYAKDSDTVIAKEECGKNEKKIELSDTGDNVEVRSPNRKLLSEVDPMEQNLDMARLIL